MKIADIERLRLHYLARAEINGFLNMAYNEEGELDLTQPDADDKAAMQQSTVAAICLTDLARYSPNPAEEDGDGVQDVLRVYLPRDVLARALLRELEHLNEEIRKAEMEH